MKRRDFLKLLGIAPLAPSVLAAKEKLLKPPEKFVGSGIDGVMYEYDEALIFGSSSNCFLIWDGYNLTSQGTVL